MRHSGIIAAQREIKCAARKISKRYPHVRQVGTGVVSNVVNRIETRRIGRGLCIDVINAAEILSDRDVVLGCRCPQDERTDEAANAWSNRMCAAEWQYHTQD